ncbi:MAG TPA: hemolysin family protein [Syntrophales bacterium]|nr:hemolysin family protein [Syntrophales bacterium]
MDNLFSVLLILLFICFEGLFSGGELALVSSDVNKIRQKANSGSRSARMTLKLLGKPDWFLSTTLSGTGLCVVTSTTIATAMFISIFGSVKGPVVAVVVMIPILLIMGEIVPKTLFQQHAEFTALRLSWFIWISSWLLFPVVFLISLVSRSTVRISTGEKDVAASPYITKDGLKFILRYRGADSDILGIEKEMIKNIIDFFDVTVGKIMIPLSTMISLPVTATLEEAAQLAADKKYLRIPVYGDKIFNIIGILHYFDLLEALHGRTSDLPRHSRNESIESYLKPVVFYVPESKLAKELLIEMLIRGERMAVIVDEYGGAVGIVTIEDILEEVVGEIEDEYDSGEKMYKKIGPGKYLINAKISIERINQIIPLDIPEGNYETLGGFLLYKMGRIPKRRDTLRYENTLFVVEDADAKSIKEVLIELPIDVDANIANKALP